ncbi:beta-lactamase class A/beta-lactamase class A CARB-5 [Rubricella aquisinus]|uniref:beta-lactamase n=1 Tax=Rubricella aquisinus TaxID=2028108 RepID=A0A840X5Y3_9RHOB|nr:beta-lactamase class A/beta-lactamase class A CARB-5 [Rubricella aquisinus]
MILITCAPLAAHAEPVRDAIHRIERDLGARVGFYMRDVESGEVITHAADDRFPLNSTFKLLACGAALHSVTKGDARLTDTVQLDEIEIVSYSPAVQAHMAVGNGTLSLDDACRMTLSVSDNTAANVVLSKIGGPAGLTAYLRSIGDAVTRLDRMEPDLNAARPGDPRDTTTPRAIANSVEHLLLGEGLPAPSRAILRGWLAQHSVADDLFRAALPPDWAIEDRTGAGGYGSRSIVAVLYPPQRQPIIAALFITETDASFPRRNAAIAEVGAAIVARTRP